MVAALEAPNRPLDFLEVVERFNQEKASVHALFGGDGDRYVSEAARSRRADSVQFQEKVRRFADFLDKIQRGRLPVRLFTEAMGTADFPLLFGDVIDRMVLANYLATNASWRAWCNYSTVADFREVHRFAMNGSESVLPTVDQNSEYPESKVTDLQYKYTVAKYGRKVPFSWEAMANDDLNALKDIPARLGRAAARTEEHFATALITGASGPISTFFSNTNKNIVNTTNGASSNNPPLSVMALQDAMTVLALQTDTEGEPIVVDGVVLVVPPGLEIVANNILHATNLTLGGFGQTVTGTNAGGGSSDQMLNVANWMQGRVKVVTDYYLPLLDGTANKQTTWYLFADPNTSRPAVEVGHLRGHETPETFVKTPNSMRVGAGMADPLDGDFDTDSLVYKIRHVMGGVLEDPRMAVVSNGSGA